MPEIIYGGEIYHFGTKGMKWGVRRYQNEDGSYKSGAEGRYSSGSHDSSKKKSKVRTYNKLYEHATKSSEAAESNWKNVKELRKETGGTKLSRLINNSRSEKKWNELIKSYDDDIAASKTDGTSEKALKMLERDREKLIKQREAVKKYSKAYESAMDKFDKADKDWAKARSAYRDTGKNIVSRVLNNIRYGK